MLIWQIVTVLLLSICVISPAPGPVDSRGYQEAEVSGKFGLVPANYLIPVTPARSGKAQKAGKVGIGMNLCYIYL